MLLVIDVGNTNITIGLYEGKGIKCHFRMTTQLPRTSDEYGIMLTELIEHHGFGVGDVSGVIIASVVPNVMYSLTSSIVKYFNTEPLIVGPGTKTGIRIDTTNPREIGPDRIVDAVAAYEIYGGPTDLPWGFSFIENINGHMQGAEPIFTQPSHPTQIYEALCYLLVFGVCMYLYWRCNAQERPGLILGVFLIGIFGSRFFIEYVKNVQEPWEVGMRNSIGLDQGQILSIPFVIAGIWLIVRALRRPRQRLQYPNRFADEKD